MGGAYGANTNLSRWETALGGKSLGVHRTYWGVELLLRRQDGQG